MQNDAKRVAYSPREFAELFGKEQTWGYRQIYQGRVSSISHYGRVMIPAAEIDRILKEAGPYVGKKIGKRERMRTAWEQYMANRRKPKRSDKAEISAKASGKIGRKEAIFRLTHKKT